METLPFLLIFLCYCLFSLLLISLLVLFIVLQVLMCICTNVLIRPLAANTFLIANKPFQIKNQIKLLLCQYGS